MDEVVFIPSQHRHGPAVHQYPLGTIVRCNCGLLVCYQMYEYDIGSGGYAWFPLSRWQRWRRRHELAGITEGGWR